MFGFCPVPAVCCLPPRSLRSRCCGRGWAALFCCVGIKGAFDCVGHQGPRYWERTIKSSQVAEFPTGETARAGSPGRRQARTLDSRHGRLPTGVERFDMASFLLSEPLPCLDGSASGMQHAPQATGIRPRTRHSSPRLVRSLPSWMLGNWLWSLLRPSGD